MKSEGPSISVVIPAYNASLHVEDAIASVIGQSCRDFEIVVVDDGSQDATPQILASYGDQIRVIRQSNQGLSAARNAGIAASRSEFVAFLDADDCWEPEKLALQAKLLRDSPEVALVHAKTLVWIPHAETTHVFTKDSAKFSGHCHDLLLDHNSICVSSVMVRRSVLDEVGVFDVEIVRPTTQDYDLWLRISRLYQFGFVDQPLVRYRSHGENASGNADIMDEDEVSVLLKRMRNDRSLTSEQLSLVRAKVARLQFDLGYRSFLRGEYGVARRWLWKSWRHSDRRARISLLLASMMMPQRCNLWIKRTLGVSHNPTSGSGLMTVL